MSKVKNIKTKIILGIILMLIAIFSGNKAFANLDHYFSAWDVYSNTSLLCVEVNQSIDINDRIHYHRIDVIYLNGTTARSENTGKTITARENAVLASILQHSRGTGLGYGTSDPYKYAVYAQSGVQNAVWMYFPTWMRAVGTNLGVIDNGFVGSGYAYFPNVGQPLIDEGNAYADNLGTAGITNSTGNVTYSFREDGNDTYVRVGPFKFNFSGTIQSLTVRGDDNREVSAALGRYNGSTWEGIGASSIGSGQDFYIEVKMEDWLTKIQRIDVTASRTVKNASIELFQPTQGWNRQHLIAYHPSTGTETVSANFDFNIPLVGKMDIAKTDITTGAAMGNVGFTLQAKSGVKKGKYVSVVNGKAVYTEEVSTIMTDANGKLSISNMYPGTYELIETVNPHYGYEDLPKVIDSNITVNPGATVQINAKNRRTYVKISGYVWEDMISGKGIDRNNLYANDTNDDNDKLVQGVKVELKNSQTGEVVETAITDENGAYRYEKVKIDDLPNLYVEFTYNGMSYTNVVVHTDVANGSKSAEGSNRPTFNEQYAIISGGQSNNSNENKTYDLSYERGDHASSIILGDNLVYGYEGAEEPVNGVYDQYLIRSNTRNAYGDRNLDAIKTPDQIRQEAIEEIPNINLGLLAREMPDLTLIQDVDNARLVLNRTEYTYSTDHTYNYGQRIDELEEAVKGEDFNVAANFGIKYSKNQVYERDIYPSDIKYNENAGGDAFQIYITYDIALRNEATSLTSTVRQISNYYDSRYTIQKITDSDGNELSYTDQTCNVSGYKKVNVDVSKEISPETTTHIFIEYRLNDEAIASILSNDMTLESVSEIISYSTVDSSGAVYAGIDKDSAPDNADITNTDTYEDDTDQAPSLVLKAENARQVTGTVFKDNVIDRLLELEGYDKERIGNGTYEQAEENVVGSVDVKLYEIYDDGSINPAIMYEGDEANEQNAETTTNNQGIYALDGLAPGRYLIRYTYKESSVIYDTQGNEIGALTDIDNYKSTLFRTTRTEDEGAGSGIDTSAKEQSDNSAIWYKNETSNKNPLRLSDARDNSETVEDRMTDKEFTFGDMTEGDGGEISEIYADTPNFEITMDTNEDDLENITEYNEQLRFVFDNIDFGIIERPVQDLKIRKEISKIEIRLANGQVIISGDPRSQNIEYVAVLPDGSLHLEIDNEIIQGATISIEYELIVDNRDCEIDYNEENYYYYGTVNDPENSFSIATVKELFDYVDKNLQYVVENQQDASIWTQLDDETLQTLIETGRFAEEVANSLKEHNYNQILFTERFDDMKPGEEQREKLVLTRILSNNEEDFYFPNDVEVNVTTRERPDTSVPGNYDPVEGEPDEPDEDEITVTITGPTGENRNYVPYIITGVGALIILIAGVVLIKTKVIKKGKDEE